MMRYKVTKGLRSALKRHNPNDQEKKRALGVFYNALLARDLLVGSRDDGQRLDVKTGIGKPAFSVRVTSIYKGKPTFELRTPYSDSVILFDHGSASALEDFIRENESRGFQKNPVSPRVKSRYASLMAEHRYEDAAKVYKRAMKRETGRKKNPLTAGLGGTYVVTHANPRSAPSKSVKLRFSSSSAAWEGMRKLDDAGIDAGYPSLGPATSGPHKGYYTVQVGRKNAAAAQRVVGGARSNPTKIPVKTTTFRKIPHASGWHTYRLVQIREGSRGVDKSAIFFAPNNDAARNYAPRALFDGARVVRLERAA